MPSAPFSPDQAIELGGFVLAAYKQFLDPASFVLPAGYSLVTTIYADDITDGDPTYFKFGFIARSGSDVVVAIRGTEGILEWIRDIEFRPVPFAAYPAAGSVEHGFLDFYESFHTGPSSASPKVVDAISALVDAGGVTSLRITGHSLGSALATMLAIDIAGHGVFVNPVVYTFASPRVGDKTFAGQYDRLITTSWRTANLMDIVTALPPIWAGYVHVDAEHPINSDDRTKHNFQCWHALDTYLNTINAAIALDASCLP